MFDAKYCALVHDRGHGIGAIEVAGLLFQFAVFADIANKRVRLHLFVGDGIVSDDERLFPRKGVSNVR